MWNEASVPRVPDAPGSRRWSQACQLRCQHPRLFVLFYSRWKKTKITPEAVSIIIERWICTFFSFSLHETRRNIFGALRAPVRADLIAGFMNHEHITGLVVFLFLKIMIIIVLIFLFFFAFFFLRSTNALVNLVAGRCERDSPSLVKAWNAGQDENDEERRAARWGRSRASNN